MEEEKHKKKKNKKAIKGVIVAVISILFICLIFSTVFALINLGNSNIIKGVSINNIDVSGNTKESALSKFTDLIDKAKSKEIVLKYEENERIITLEELEIEYKTEKAVDEAYLVGRSSNILINNFNIMQALINKKNINIDYSFNEEKFNSIIADFNSTLPEAVIQYDYSIEEDELIITKGKPGIAIDLDSLYKDIKKEINSLSTNGTVIDVKVKHSDPDEINLEKIHKEIYKEAEDAYISDNPKTVHPNVNGVDFKVTMEEAKELLKEDKEEYIIPLKITIANKTLNDLGEEAFPTQLGTYSTKFNVSNTNRCTNIRLATEKINGTVVLPGEVFSYNKTVGKRTIAAGFKEAGAYAGGKVVQEVGGGICQVSSTLYNAVLYANLEIVERTNHCFECSYIAASRDATVSWGTLDFKFKNTRKYPIKVVASSKNGVETVSIYGLPEEIEYEVIIQDKRTGTVSRTTKYVDDDTIAEGEELVTETGHDGCTSEAYRILRLNGETVSTTLLSKDRYDALARVINRGTKKTVETVAPVEEPETKIETKTTEETPKNEEKPKTEEPSKNEEKPKTNTVVENAVSEEPKENKIVNEQTNAI